MYHLNYTILQDRQPVAVILRHAERYPVVDPLAHSQVLLTEKGLEDAYNLGKTLSFLRPIMFYASPVTRCQQTAEGIAKGIFNPDGTPPPVSYLYALGGPYILGEWTEIMRLVQLYGISTYLRMWFDGKLPKDLLMPVEEAAHLEFNILKKQLEQHENAINITHDWNIMIMRQYFFNLRHEDIGYPNFLDGITAYMENEKICMVYHDHLRSVDIRNQTGDTPSGV